MNFNQYFCNEERIYLMQGVLEFNRIAMLTSDIYDLLFEKSQYKHFIINERGHLSNMVWAAINGEFNIERKTSSTKVALTVYGVKLV